MDKIEVLLRARKTVFTADEICLIWHTTNMNSFKALLCYYEQKGKLRRIRRGVYTPHQEYDHFELAQKLFTPSYISFLTALQYHGISFQHSESITSAALNRKELKVDGATYMYSRLKESVLFNNQGILQKEFYQIADAERAICDSLYHYGNYYFDNLKNISADKLKTYMKIYGNMSLEKRVLELCNIVNNVSRS